MLGTIGNWWSTFAGLVEAQQSAWAYLISSSIVGLISAYAGAMGAQRSINRENRLRRRTDLIMAANAAQSLAGVIFNQAASLKKQHYLPGLRSWQYQREQAEEALRNNPTAPIEVRIEFLTPPAIYFPTDALAESIYAKLSLNGRPLAALSEIVQAQYTLSHLVEQYQTYREELNGQPATYVIPRYLALATPEGRDDRYKDLVENSVTVLDDLIFFSDLLGRDLIAYGAFVRRRSTRREKRALPAINEMGKLLPGYEYLIPQDSKHTEWLERNIWTMTETKPWWRRIYRAR